jgi:coenzyme F420-0:L-glutamate ligase/coenzyme F420-1:gamma-L-glutamate ligase
MSAPEPVDFRILGLRGLPEVEPADDLVQLTLSVIDRAGVKVEHGDVFVYTQKIVSKAEDRLVALDSVAPSDLAREWGEAWARDPRAIELALRDAKRIVRMDRGVLITETIHGFVCANSGVDTSNVQPGWAARLPADPDASARLLCEDLRTALQLPVGVIISDTFGRPWREGQTNVAIGVAGLSPIRDYRGSSDTQGQPLRSTAIAIADELAAAAELVMGKLLNIPVALVQGTGLGVAGLQEGSGRDLLRRPDGDLFR